MKKYFICSDIHSFYRPFMTALKEKGFNKNNPEHILIICGDCFDRGPDSVDLYKFLKTFPEERCILIRGNHEDLFLELLEKRRIDNYDISNGTVKTLYSIAGKETLYDELLYGNSWWAFGMDRNLVNDIIAMREKSFKNILNYKKIKEFKDFLNSDRWLDYYETNNYIFTHSFIPVKAKAGSLSQLFGYDIADACDSEYDPDWRKLSRAEWEAKQARWGNPWKQAYYDLNKTGKYIVCGHWHTSDFYNSDLEEKLMYEEITEEEFEKRQLSRDNNPIYSNSKTKLIGLDACTVLSYRVNVLVLNEEEM